MPKPRRLPELCCLHLPSLDCLLPTAYCLLLLRTTRMARLLDQYNTTIAPAIATKFNLTNKMAIPKLEKIVINMGVGRATQDKALLEAAVDSLGKISGQKPLVTKARDSVAGFRLREGNEIGCKVTLRGRRMYEFLDRLVSIALRRIRDFRGVNPNSEARPHNFVLGVA